MTTFADIEMRIDQLADGFGRHLAACAELGCDDPPIGAVAPRAADALLRAGEQCLEQWVMARGDAPTAAAREGFRLLALHAQGARGEPSFHACRETCRELAYHYNLIVGEPGHPDVEARVTMMAFVARHLLLFVAGKMQVQGLGEFCCAARPARQGDAG